MKLSAIQYTRLDFEKIMIQLQAIIDRCSKDESAEVVLETYDAVEAIEIDVISMASYVSLKYADNTADAFFTAEYMHLMQESPKLETKLNDYFRVLVRSKYKDTLVKKIGSTRFKIMENAALSSNEATTAIDAEINNLTQKYQVLFSQATYTVDATQYNQMSLMKLMTDPDRSIRKKAIEAESHFLEANKKVVADIFDQLVKLRNQKARALGFENYLEFSNIAMNRIGYNTDDIAQYRNHAAKHLSPLLNKIQQHKISELGLESLKYYDEAILFAKGNPTPKGDQKTFMKNVVTMYESLSKETGAFIHRMIDNELLLIENKPNKMNGGFATMIPKYKFTPMLTSLTQSTFDFVVMTHELGHSFQIDAAFRHGAGSKPLPTIDVAEIFSHTMEFLTLNWVDLFFDEDAMKYKLFNIHRAYSMLNKLCIGDEFQEIIYKNENLTDEERNSIYLSLTEKYNSRKDYDDNAFAAAGHEWKSNGHIITIPFYYIDYALATYVAIYLWKIIKEDFDKGWHLYLELCNKSHTLCYGDVIKELNIPSPFIEENIKEISLFLAKEMDQIIANLKTPHLQN